MNPIHKANLDGYQYAAGVLLQNGTNGVKKLHADIQMSRDFNHFTEFDKGVEKCLHRIELCNTREEVKACIALIMHRDFGCFTEFDKGVLRAIDDYSKLLKDGIIARLQKAFETECRHRKA